MHNKISTSRVESTLRLDWANFLETQIQEIKRTKSVKYTDAKMLLRNQIGFTKDQLNSHLRCENTVDIVQFYSACAMLNTTYVINSGGYGVFIATDSIFSSDIIKPKF